MSEFPGLDERRKFIVAELDALLQKRVVLRERWALLADVASVNGDQNAADLQVWTENQGYSLNEKIGELLRRLLELPE